MAFGTRITEVDQISSLDGVDDIYVRKGNNFYRMDANAFMAAMNAKTYTTLTRDSQTVTVHCHGLRDDKTYKLCLYTASRHRGSKMGAWYHPDNYDVEPVAGASDHRIGYGKLAGKAVYGVGVDVFPDVPSWMPNNGFLQTEWNVSAGAQTATIDLITWLPPMVKPVGKTIWTTDNVESLGIFVTGHMIGVSNKHFAGLLFRFCPVDDEGIAYPCLDTLTVGCGKWKNQDDKLVPRVFVSSTDKALIARDSCLYTSIR